MLEIHSASRDRGERCLAYMYTLIIAIALYFCSPVLAVAQSIDPAANAPPGLMARLNGLSKPEGRSIGGVPIAGHQFLPKLYKAFGYQLIWKSPENVSALKEAVKRSWEDGLLPNDFHDERVAGFAEHKTFDSEAVVIHPH
jgi:hypothetical protein